MDFTQFDFKKFTELCRRDTNGFLDLRDNNNRNEFMKYVNENNIECSGYVNLGASLVWFDNRGGASVRGADTSFTYGMKIYPFEDFIQDSASFNIGDILGFLEV